MASSTNYGGFWLRFVAMIVDAIALGIIGRVVDLVLETSITSGSSGAVSVNFSGWSMIIPIAYTLGFWLWKGATPGKMLLGLKITKLDGGKIGVKEAVLRYIGYFVSAIVIGLGFLWISWDAKKQGWHDKIAGTVVVKTK